MTDIEKFETLKKKIDNLNVKKMAAQSEYKRFEEQFNKTKSQIKEVYKVEIEDFAKAIEIMKSEYESKLNELETLVSQAETKMENKK